MADILKTFGAKAVSSGGFMVGINPDRWLESFTRALERYVEERAPGIYDIRFSFPGAKETAEFAKLNKTVIHFEIDDIDNPRFGLGMNEVDAIYDDPDVSVQMVEAKPHVVNMDIGIWASPNSGGTTSRMRAYQLLDDLFNGPSAYVLAQDERGFEIVSFTGGTFIREEISDVPVFRATGIMLVIRVFGRKVKDAIPYIEDIEVDPGLEISGLPVG